MNRYNKLVRDGIPEHLEARGIKYTSRILKPDERKRALLRKLIEEAQELCDDPGLAERADVAEVLIALDAAHEFTPEAIEEARIQKLNEKGGFEKAVFLESTD